MNLEDSRRLMSVRINTGLIAKSLKQGVVLDKMMIEEGVPADAQLVNSYTEYATNNTVLTFTHPSFGVVDDCRPVPFMVIIVKRVLP